MISGSRTLAAFAGLALGMGMLQAADSPTFHKDLLPIFQRNCQGCHRPGEVAPFSLVTYQAARPWAKAIKAAVIARKMPPWTADPAASVHFSNDARLSDADIKTISAWVDAGAPEGNPKDAPTPLKFVEGWNLNPDMIVEMPQAFPIPASGAIEYQFTLVKVNFPEDVWVSAAEMRPGDSRVVHHGEVWVRPPGSKWMADAIPGKSYSQSEMRKDAQDSEVIGKFNPGVGAQDFVIGDSAKFIPKGSDLIFERHYTTIGQETTDLTKVGFVFAKGEHKSRYYMSYGPQALNLAIAPGDANAEVVSEMTLTEPATLVYVQPHMHVRGKDYELRLIYPTGETQTVIKGKFDFNWQIGAELAEPIHMPKGTRMVGISHFDNSPNNPFNPDPKAAVKWGPQNWEEMSNCFMGLIYDRNIDPKKASFYSGPSKLPRGTSGPTLSALAPPSVPK
jgi:hypothetical protein